MMSELGLVYLLDKTRLKNTVKVYRVSERCPEHAVNTRTYIKCIFIGRSMARFRLTDCFHQKLLRVMLQTDQTGKSMILKGRKLYLYVYESNCIHII